MRKKHVQDHEMLCPYENINYEFISAEYRAVGSEDERTIHYSRYLLRQTLWNFMLSVLNYGQTRCISMMNKHRLHSRTF